MMAGLFNMRWIDPPVHCWERRVGVGIPSAVRRSATWSTE
jgi:hypothetical protein